MRLKARFSLLLACVICSHPAYSAESLRFQSAALPDEVRGMMVTYAPEDAWSVSRIDLNNDGRDELILKTEADDCDARRGCDYLVAAEKSSHWIQLGRIKAFNILVSDKRTYGVRDLIVYNIPNNDFESVRYVWKPKSFKYEEK